jgi:hypothetical protein
MLSVLLIILFILLAWYVLQVLLMCAALIKLRIVKSTHHIWIIKTAAKKGALLTLIRNCNNCVSDYVYWNSYKGVKHFFHKEWFLCKYADMYKQSSKILAYLSDPKKYNYYEKINEYNKLKQDEKEIHVHKSTK